mgnify:CR=1 FL=1
MSNRKTLPKLPDEWLAMLREAGRKGGRIGGKVRASRMGKEGLSAFAKKMVAAREAKRKAKA